MKLSDYLAAPGRTATELANATGVAVSTITRAAKGDIIPSGALMAAILEATGGAVTPNDFFDVKTPLPPATPTKPKKASPPFPVRSGGTTEVAAL